ncbi:MAG TPA: 16S rRNA (adenine(1518)-N(6)/adenine(1519)-N(6))-dimethyltransferase RsmA [Rubricoccaceae bacterium]
MSVRPKKRLGQHFLTDAAVVQAIAEAVRAPAGSHVVEIGPGEGVLTADLMRSYPNLTALEVDPEAVAHLRARFPRLDLREADVLEVDWRAIHAEAGEGTPLTVVGNLPYYITSPILFSLLDARPHIGRAVVMVQREVAERLVAPHGSKTYGTLSVYFQLFARATALFDVSRHAFRPPPAVESAVVAIDFGVTAPDVPFEALQRVVKAAFGQRRKMFRNSVAPLFAAVGREMPATFETLRPEAVSPADFVALAQALAGAATPPEANA